MHAQRGGFRGWGKHGGWKGGGERKQVLSAAGEEAEGGSVGKGGGRENVTHGWPLSSDGANDVVFNSNGSGVSGSGEPALSCGFDSNGMRMRL